MGQSSGQQTSTTKQDPWSGQQPYLQDIFSQANSAYNSGVGGQYFPGSTVVPFSPDTESGMGQIRNTASQPAQGFDQASNVTNQAMTGGQPNQMGVLGQAAQGGMQNSVIGQLQGQSAGMGQINQASNASTPYVNQMVGAANQNTTAGVNTLQQSANGSMLNSNPYMDQNYNNAARQVADNTNAQFSLGGRYGSGAHTDVLSRNLGDMAGQMYGQNYANERQNQLGAANSLGSLQANDINRSVSGYGQAAGYGAGDLSRQMSGGQAMAGIDQSRLGMLGSLQEQGFGRQMDAANASNQYGLNQTSQGLQAAQSLPALRQYGMSGAQDLMGLGQMQEGQAQQQLQDQMNRWNFQQQSPWDQLGRYSGLVGGMGNLGGTQTSTTPTTSNPYMGALGGAATGMSIGGPWGAAAGGLLGYMGSRG